METLLYKPLFINPQAYYVFPNINGRLEPKTGSGKEPAMFIGNIEVKTIAHGDIGKKQYFYNTNEIDLSAFSNSLVRISLYTNRGNVVLGEWDLDIIEGESENYIDPEILDSLCGVWIADQNTNESESRNIIKNKIVDRGGDFELQNFGYKLNSGYGKYEEDFTSWEHGLNVMVYHNKFTYTEDRTSPANIIHLKINKRAVNSFKIKVEGLPDGQILAYSYFKQENDNERTEFLMKQNGEYILPPSMTPSSTTEDIIGFYNTQYKGNIKGLTIAQIPSHQGALVTDGVDDLIVSQKTVSEMLGGSNEVTVVSMIHCDQDKSLLTNYIRKDKSGKYVRNLVTAYGETGIYGYTSSNLSQYTVINNILGDKEEITTSTSGGKDVIDSPFSVEGCYIEGDIFEVGQVAWYWTFIANKVLTTDQINQVISYFNLDKHVKPDVYYDVKRQGLTNDTPNEDWYLKDFSGNGHDMQLYNYAKSKDSGIGKYELDFNEFTTNTNINTVLIEKNKDTFYAETLVNSSVFLIYKTIQANNTLTDTPSFKAKVEINKGITLQYRYINSDGVQSFFNITEEGEHEFPISYNNRYVNSAGVATNGFVLYGKNMCRITQIPDYEGALVSDGKDDYGKAEGLPILKDYTVASKYSRFESTPSYLLSKAAQGNDGAFIFNDMSSSYSFATSSEIDTHTLFSTVLRYQSKYINQGRSINAGFGIDTDSLWLSIIRDNDNRLFAGAFYSMLLFPYSLSEFLLERQLKKYKLGTLYPDMVEFRPVISGNIPYNAIEISQGSTTLYNKSINKTGIYLQEGSTVRVYIQPSGIDEVSKITVNGVEYTDLPINPNGFYYADFPIAKSPQKISYAIDEYIRYEDIVQPYPAIINLKQDGKTITWGDKLKVGSDIVFAGSANLLPELYTVSETRYNGVTLYPNTIIKVEKSMVFDNARTYLKANEPSCILSPNRLRIPNSSYKILGYIPDLTGKGNHGVINNSAYVGMSGANGYVYNWNTWRISKSGITSTITDNSLHITSLKGQYNPNQALFEPNTVANTGDKSNFKVNITGLTSDMKCTFNNAGSIMKELINGVNEISVDLVAGWYGFMITTLDGSVIGDCDITIQQIGQYEGSFCLDGVDDFVTIPTLAHGGKQVLIKVNYKLNNGTICTIYDQRDSTRWLPTFCIYSNNEAIAYSDGNSGKTYIDGVLNTSVKGRQLANITHNITIANEDVTDVNSVSPKIGTLFANGSAYAQMALFDFMLFPEISSEDEIKELNNIIGIEGNTDDLLTKINI